jgi:cell division protease FtsH
MYDTMGILYDGYEIPFYYNSSNNINSESNIVSNNKNTVLIFILSFYIFVLWIFFRLISYSDETEPTYESKSYNFTQSSNNITSFDNLKKVVGLETVKNEIRYYMDFINNKNKYIEWNVKLPKGIMLIGPPGTGKTLLVKSMAKDLNIPFISMAGSEFIEVYVGVGAKRVRKLFSEARHHKKCIIFIDEIDAVGGKRGYDTNSERASTLNQLLVEMDGFDDLSNIIVFGATNLEKNLDPALMRSGRFDKKIFFDPPNLDERKQLFNLYLENVKLEEKLSLENLSMRTAGLTGADIANIVNQAKINAIQDKSEDNNINEKNIQVAIDEVMIGREKRERMLSSLERERVAHHEAGHAIMGFLLKDCSPPIKVSIIPRGQYALGFSQPKPEDRKLYTESFVLSQILVLLGGRVAEKIIYDDYSTGASDDIEKASNLIYRYCVEWGMNKNLGPLNIEHLGKVGKGISDSVYKECQDLIKKIEEVTEKYLIENEKSLKKIAKDLLKNETITYKRIKQLMPKKKENSVKFKLN